jgi:ubiquinone/menaquinone biosynthesis C-methylase UbiE
LEVAVGTGLAFLHVVRANPDGRNVGIDTSRGMLSKAERRLQKAGLANYELSIGDALVIQEADNAFEVLLNSYMLDLMDEHAWITVLAEFHRVLKPGGRLVLVNMTFGERPGSGIYQRLYGLSPALMGGCRGIRMSDLLQGNGFTVHSREYIQQLLFPSEVILASKGNAQQV